VRRRRLILSASLIALLAALLWLGGFWAFVFYAVLSALAVGWAMTYRAPSRLQIERFCNLREADIGQAAEVRVRVRNAGAIPVAWMLAEDLAVPPMVATGVRGELSWLLPGREMVLEYRVYCRRRGYYRLGPVLLETGDYFGLLRRFMARPPVSYITVFPTLLPLGRAMVPTSRPMGEVRVSRDVVEDPSRPAGVREYRRGDPLRRIHWKATAHTGRLHSRVYEFTRLQGANVVLDFGRDSWPAPASQDDPDLGELAVTVAASIAAHMRERGQEFGLVSNGLDQARMIEAWPRELDVPGREAAAELLELRKPPERYEPVVVPVGRGDEALQLVLGALARLGTGTGLSLAELIRREHPAWPRELATVLIVPALTEDLLGAAGVLRAARFPVTVILVGHAAVTGVAGRLGEGGVRLLAVADEEGVTRLEL
jgi:uncharacterized protein (DUF58 family)